MKQDAYSATALELDSSPECESLTTFCGIVYPWHLDHMGQMNVQHYVGMCDTASWVLLGQLGLDAAYFRENHRGMADLEPAEGRAA